MVASGFSRFVQNGYKVYPLNGLRYITTSHSLMIKWRIKKGIEPNPNRYGPLTNLPDYSFVDGRTVPLSGAAYRKMKLQEEYCRRIVQLSSEIDFAVERHKKIQKEKEETEEKIISSKLKPKGINLRDGTISQSVNNK